MKHLLVLLLVGSVGGCSATSLPYKPDTGNVPVSASHQLTPRRLYVHVDSAGWRVESAALAPDVGAEIAPVNILHPSQEISSGVGTGINVGAGGGSIRRSGVDMSVGTGLAGDYAHTVIVFPADRAGPGPWRLRIKIARYPETWISLPALASAEDAAQ